MANAEVARTLHQAGRYGDDYVLTALLDPQVEREPVGPIEIPYLGGYRMRHLTGHPLA